MLDEMFGNTIRHWVWVHVLHFPLTSFHVNSYVYMAMQRMCLRVLFFFVTIGSCRIYSGRCQLLAFGVALSSDARRAGDASPPRPSPAAGCPRFSSA